jgi:metallo-beta-lactamase family protein
VDAGHLLGSAMIHVRVDTPGGQRRLTFTGDLGRPGLPILRAPSPVPPAEVLISECTYGGHTHETVEETAERLGEVVRRTAQRGGKVIIPAFSVGRTQTVVYFLHRRRAIADIPVFMDSSPRRRHYSILEYPTCSGERIRYIKSTRYRANDRRAAAIISATARGRIIHHLAASMTGLTV